MPYFKGICSAVRTPKRLSERGVDTLEALRRTDALAYRMAVVLVR